MPKNVTLQLPEELYEHLKQAAAALQQPVETVLVQVVQAGLPPAVEDLPPEQRDDFEIMARLSDCELWKIAHSSLSKAKQRQLSSLLNKNQLGNLTESEHRKLESLRQEVSLITLRKAHAYALLKWRNQRIPTLDELCQE
ncbi:MAG TPA: hypothetical protein ENI60_08255 [Candidatus Fraserbacteria bacterium]|nr:hypothetical protein [Candidatus Fraserbacteria bacterium]